MVNAADAMERIGAFELPGVQLEPIRLESFPELLDLAESQRMLPWVSAAATQNLLEDVSPEELEALKSRTLASIQTTLAAHAAAARVVARLADIGVTDVRVLKGCATGYLDYSPLSRRFSSDVDLLVRPDDYDAAITAFPGPRTCRFREAQSSNGVMARPQPCATGAA